MKNFLTSLFKPKSPKPISADEKIFELVENLYLKHKRNPNISSSVADITITTVGVENYSSYILKISPFSSKDITFVFVSSRFSNFLEPFFYDITNFNIVDGKTIVPLRSSDRVRVYDIVLGVLEKTLKETEERLEETYSSIGDKLKTLEDTFKGEKHD